jgi:transposase-like protein
MKPRRIYEGRFKAKVVIESFRKGESLEELAKRYEIHPNQIKNWKSILLRHASEILDDKRLRRPK